VSETEWQSSTQQAGDALEQALATADPARALADLATAGRAVDAAIQEAMAAAVLAGTSMRRVAEIAGIAPNSVPPRLARSAPLAPYVAAGTITADSIAVARHDAATGRRPLIFTPRRKDTP